MKLTNKRWTKLTDEEKRKLVRKIHGWKISEHRDEMNGILYAETPDGRLIDSDDIPKEFSDKTTEGN